MIYVLVIVLPIIYLVLLLKALLTRPGWGTSFLLIGVSLAMAIVGAYAGIAAASALWPGTSGYDRAGNNFAGMIVCGPLGGLLGLGLVWVGAMLRRR